MHRYLTKIILLSAFAAVLSGSAFFLLLGMKELENSKAADTVANRYRQQQSTIACRFYDEGAFRRSVGLLPVHETIKTQIKGGIVTHHLLAARLIASFFKTASQADPEVVVIIAPNHKREGDSLVQSCNADWVTPFGTLECDTAVEGLLLGFSEGTENLSLMEEDHSINSLIPYVKYYMPETKVVPLMLNGNYGKEQSVSLGKYLARILESRRYLIIGSIDFSHYLTPEKADKMDEITKRAIMGRDYDRIAAMTNDNLDCPPALMSLLAAMDYAGADSITELDHCNSAEITGTYSTSTTSYFTMLFSK